MKKLLLVIGAVALLSGCDDTLTNTKTKGPVQQNKEASWGIGFCGEKEKVKELYLARFEIQASWVKCNDGRSSTIPMQGFTG